MCVTVDCIFVCGGRDLMRGRVAILMATLVLVVPGLRSECGEVRSTPRIQVSVRCTGTTRGRDARRGWAHLLGLVRRRVEGWRARRLPVGALLAAARVRIEAEDLYVSFDNNSSKSITDPITDPIQVEELHQMRVRHDLGDLHDLAVLLLAEGSVGGIPPVVLPPAGYLDSLKAAGTLKFGSPTSSGTASHRCGIPAARPSSTSTVCGRPVRR